MILDAPGVSREESDDEDGDLYGLPVTHEAVLGGHQKIVTAIDVEHSGSRVVTGSHDYHIQLYDFNGMKSDLKSFRCVHIRQRAWSLIDLIVA